MDGSTPMPEIHSAADLWPSLRFVLEEIRFSKGFHGPRVESGAAALLQQNVVLRPILS